MMRQPYQRQWRHAIGLMGLLVANAIPVIVIASIDSKEPIGCGQPIAVHEPSNKPFRDVHHLTLAELRSGKIHLREACSQVHGSGINLFSPAYLQQVSDSDPAQAIHISIGRNLLAHLRQGAGTETSCQHLIVLEMELQEMIAEFDNRCHFEQLRNGKDTYFPNANQGELTLIDPSVRDGHHSNCTSWSLGYQDGWKHRSAEYVAWVEAMNRIDFHFFDKRYGNLGYKRIQRDQLYLVYDLDDPDRGPTVDGEWTEDGPVDEYDFQLQGKDLVAVYGTYVNKEKKWIHSVTHFARKGRDDRLWSSKLGAKGLVGHETLSQLEGTLYGEVIAIYAKD